MVTSDAKSTSPVRHRLLWRRHKKRIRCKDRDVVNEETQVDADFDRERRPLFSKAGKAKANRIRVRISHPKRWHYSYTHLYWYTKQATAFVNVKTIAVIGMFMTLSGSSCFSL